MAALGLLYPPRADVPALSDDPAFGDSKVAASTVATAALSVQAGAARYQLSPGETDIQGPLNLYDVVALAQGETYTNTSAITIPSRTELHMPSGAVISRAVASSVAPIIRMAAQRSRLTGSGKLLSDGALPHGAIYFGPLSALMYPVTLTRAAGSATVSAPGSDIPTGATFVGIYDGDVLRWESYAVSAVTASSMTLDRAATTSGTALAFVAVGALATCFDGLSRDVWIETVGGVGIMLASAPQGSGFGTFACAVENCHVQGAEHAVSLISQANGNRVHNLVSRNITGAPYRFLSADENVVTGGFVHQSSGATTTISMMDSSFNSILGLLAEPGGSVGQVTMDDDCESNTIIASINASGPLAIPPGRANTTIINGKYRSDDNGSYCIVPAARIRALLSHLRTCAWWLAPQQAKAAWVNRGTASGVATLAAGATFTDDDLFRRVGSAGNSHVTLPSQPFALGPSGTATFATTFRYAGVGGSTANARILEARSGSLGMRALIDASGQIGWSVGDGTTVVSEVTTPIPTGVDLTLVMAYTGTASLVVSLHDKHGTTIYTGSRSVAALGDCTPSINPQVFGTSSANYVNGEYGDIVIDAATAWDSDRAQAASAALAMRDSGASATRRRAEEVRV